MSQLTFGEQRTEVQKLYDARVLARVKRGIKFCEKVYGPNWVDHIDLTALDLRSGSRCVLGQLEFGASGDGYSDYEDAVEKYMGGDDNLAVKRGFNAHGGQSSEYDALQECWLDVLTPLIKTG